MIDVEEREPKPLGGVDVVPHPKKLYVLTFSA